jgi:gamma-glutamyltranspeptidase/glutathione hydrolase
MSTTVKAFVASGHPQVSKAATDILRLGGNAFDAAIGAGFASAVVEPALTSLGGGGFLLAKTSGARGPSEETFFDFFVDTPGRGLPHQIPAPHFFPVTVHFPSSDQIFNIGFGSVAVPGNLKGFLHVHERLGRLPLGRILAPAIQLARQGFTINSTQAYFLNLLKPIITFSPTGKTLYTKNQRYIKADDFLVNPDLANFLELLAEDKGSRFYFGDLAALMDHDMRQGDGLLTNEDLASYKVIERHPLSASYREYTLLTNPPPSMGGSLVALALSILENHDFNHLAWGSTEHIHLMANLMLEVDSLRNKKITDHDVRDAARRMTIFNRGTTHISIADTEGNVASMTTSNGEGAGYFVPGTGIMLNNMMGEDDLHPNGFHVSPPGQRVCSMMSPSLLLKDGEVILVLGSGGSKRIRTAITQVLVNIVDFHLEVQQAVEVPRIHWDGQTLHLEPGLAPETTAYLERHLPVNIWQEKDMYFGGVHAVRPGSGGGGDPRRGGAVAEVAL